MYSTDQSDDEFRNLCKEALLFVTSDLTPYFYVIFKAGEETIAEKACFYGADPGVFEMKNPITQELERYPIAIYPIDKWDDEGNLVVDRKNNPLPSDELRTLRKMEKFRQIRHLDVGDKILSEADPDITDKLVEHCYKEAGRGSEYRPRALNFIYKNAAIIAERDDEEHKDQLLVLFPEPTDLTDLERASHSFGERYGIRPVRYGHLVPMGKGNTMDYNGFWIPKRLMKDEARGIEEQETPDVIYLKTKAEFGAIQYLHHGPADEAAFEKALNEIAQRYVKGKHSIAHEAMYSAGQDGFSLN
jgi:hypothetical protein